MIPEFKTYAQRSEPSSFALGSLYAVASSGARVPILFMNFFLGDWDIAKCKYSKYLRITNNGWYIVD